MASPEKQFERAVAAFQNKKFTNAKKIISQLERDVGGHPQILHLKAFIEVELGTPDKAIIALADAAQHFPNDGNIFNAMGVSLRKAGRHKEAETAHLRAIKLTPNDAAFYQSFGHLFSEIGNLSEAVSNYQKALQLDPSFSEVALVLATDLDRAGQKDDATTVLETQIQRDPLNINLRIQLATLEHQSSNLPAAKKWYQSVAEIEPDNTAAAGGLMSIGVLQGGVEDALNHFEQWQAIHGRNHHLGGAYVHALNYRPNVNPQILRKAAEALKASLRLSGPPPSFRRGNRPLKVGIASRRFGAHPVNYFSHPVLAACSRDDIEFELFASNVPVNSASQSIQSMASQWHDITHMDAEERATFVRSRNLDIAISPSGHEESELLDLFRVRIAPIQIAAFAIFGTTGVKQMDGLLSDQFQTPEGSDDGYSENLIRMPNGYICFQPYPFMPEIEPIGQRSGPVFGSFNNIAKICDATLSLWSKVLNAVPNASLLIKTVALGDDETRTNFIKRAQNIGIDIERLTLEGPSNHLELLKSYHRVDVALDPLAYSGGLTTLEALWMGTPVVTLPGATFARRHSLSHLSVAGLDQWVANSTDHYVQIAAQLADETRTHSDFRTWLRCQMAVSSTNDAVTYSRDLVQCLQKFIN